MSVDSPEYLILIEFDVTGDSRSQTEEFNSACKYAFEVSILSFEICIIGDLMVP